MPQLNGLHGSSFFRFWTIVPNVFMTSHAVHRRVYVRQGGGLEVFLTGCVSDGIDASLEFFGPVTVFRRLHHRPELVFAQQADRLRVLGNHLKVAFGQSFERLLRMRQLRTHKPC